MNAPKSDVKTVRSDHTCNEQQQQLTLLRFASQVQCRTCYLTIFVGDPAIVDINNMSSHLACVHPRTLYQAVPGGDYSTITGWHLLPKDIQEVVQKKLDRVLIHVIAAIASQKKQLIPAWLLLMYPNIICAGCKKVTQYSSVWEREICTNCGGFLHAQTR